MSLKECLVECHQVVQERYHLSYWYSTRLSRTGIVEIYRVWGTEGDVLVRIYRYICISQVSVASMNVEKGGVNYAQGSQ